MYVVILEKFSPVASMVHEGFNGVLRVEGANTSLVIFQEFIELVSEAKRLLGIVPFSH